VIIVYGVTFLSALLLAFNGITPQRDRIGYLLLALLTGAVGVAIALRAIDTTRMIHVAALGVGVWLLNVTSVWIGAQSFTAWLESSFFVCMTLILGRFMVGIRLESMPPPDFADSHSVPRQPSTTQAQGSKRPAR
jgi:uncharacterized membrane protein YfcA